MIYITRHREKEETFPRWCEQVCDVTDAHAHAAACCTSWPEASRKSYFYLYQKPINIR